MGGSGRDVAGLVAAAVVSVAAAFALTVAGPKPSADVSRGSEDAFATGLLLELLLAAAIAYAAGRVAGAPVWPSGAIAIAVVLVATALLWPSGVARSPYAPRLCAAVAVGLVLACAFARAVGRRWPAA